MRLAVAASANFVEEGYPNVLRMTTRVCGSSSITWLSLHSVKSLPKLSVVSCAVYYSLGDLVPNSFFGCKISAIILTKQMDPRTSHTETLAIVSASKRSICPVKVYSESCSLNRTQLYPRVTVMVLMTVDIIKFDQYHTDFDKEAPLTVRKRAPALDTEGERNIKFWHQQP